MLSDLITGMIGMAAYIAMNKSDTRTGPILPRPVYEAAWKVFDPWWEANKDIPRPWLDNQTFNLDGEIQN